MIHSKTIGTIIKKRKMNFKVRDMRKGIFMTVLWVVAVFIGGVSFAQTDVSFTTQAQINDFSTTATEVTGDLNIGNALSDSNITDLSPLSNLTTVGDDFYIIRTLLTSLSGLGSLTSIGGLLNINNNDSLTSLEGLGELTTVTENLLIYKNAKISTLSGLNKLTTLGGSLGVGTGFAPQPNPLLTNFCAISQLVLGDNPQLTTSEYFVVNNGYNPTHAGLGNNRAATTDGGVDGCRKFGTAPDTVPPVVISTNTFSKEDGYRLFPNPVTDVLFVKSESKITSITISNVSGQEVLKGKRAKINVQNLSKGIYFARIVSGEKTIVEKFVKL